MADSEKSCTKYIVICDDGDIKQACDTEAQKAEDAVLGIVGKAFTAPKSFVVIAKTQKSRAKMLHYLEQAYAKLPSWLSKNVISACGDASSCMKFKSSSFAEVVQNEIVVASF